MGTGDRRLGVGLSLLLAAGCTDRVLVFDDPDGEGMGGVDEPEEPDAPRPDPPCTPGQPGCACPNGQVFDGTACVTPLGLALATASNPLQSALAGDVVPEPPTAVVRTLDGTPAAGVEVAFAATAGAGGSLANVTAVTDANGIASSGQWRLGKLAGTYQIAATIPADPSIPAVTFDADTLGDFEITLVYINPVTPEQEAAFEAARMRWQGIVLNALPAEEGDLAVLGSMCGYAAPSQPIINQGVVVFVDLRVIDGTGSGGVNILGQAGPCVLRTERSPSVGGMTFDTADLDMLQAAGQLETVVLHEMGHVLGVGTLWPERGLLVDSSIELGQGVDTHFIGPSAQQAFFDVLGGQPYDGSIVPVENSGSPGSADGHWRENVLINELMTPSLGDLGIAHPLSLLTVSSLADHGYYATNPFGADAFVVPQGLYAEPGFAAGPKRIDEVLEPRWIRQSDGSYAPL